MALRISTETKSPEIRPVNTLDCKILKNEFMNLILKTYK